jgi:hypothetical protein
MKLCENNLESDESNNRSANDLDKELEKLLIDLDRLRILHNQSVDI